MLYEVITRRNPLPCRDRHLCHRQRFGEGGLEMAKLPDKREETLGGYIVHGIPFPVDTDPESLAFLKRMAPIQIEQDYQITYLHSYAQDSPWFAGLTQKRLLANQDPEGGYTYANPP